MYLLDTSCIVTRDFDVFNDEFVVVELIFCVLTVLPNSLRAGHYVSYHVSRGREISLIHIVLDVDGEVFDLETEFDDPRMSSRSCVGKELLSVCLSSCRPLL